MLSFSNYLSQYSFNNKMAVQKLFLIQIINNMILYQIMRTFDTSPCVKYEGLVAQNDGN